MNSYKKAMNTVVNELRKSKDYNSMYYAWQSNIAMAIIDTVPEDKICHKEANEAAKRFLDNLTM